MKTKLPKTRQSSYTMAKMVHSHTLGLLARHTFRVRLVRAGQERLLVVEHEPLHEGRSAALRLRIQTPNRLIGRPGFKNGTNLCPQMCGCLWNHYSFARQVCLSMRDSNPPTQKNDGPGSDKQQTTFLVCLLLKRWSTTKSNN